MKKLGFGFMRLPVFDEQDRSTVDLDAVKKMVDCFMERGFTFFYTAHRYNDEASEPAIRECLGYIRHIGFSFHGTADVLEQILEEHPETELVAETLE